MHCPLITKTKCLNSESNKKELFGQDWEFVKFKAGGTRKKPKRF